MKIFIIILFFIIYFVLMLKVQIDIKKVEIFNQKIKFNIYIKIYLFNKIQLYKRKVRKKDILKLIQLSKKRKIVQEEKKILKILSIDIEKINIEIAYNLKNQVHMAYLYGILQTITNIGIAIINPNERKIIIKSQYRGKTYINISTKISINIAKTIINKLKIKKKSTITL